MAYDAQLHGIAQRYFTQAMRLAKEAGNTAYGSFILATVSHQALYIGRPKHAPTLAQTAQHNYHDDLISTMETEAVMMQATAYSAMGDRTNCEKALSQAERLFERQNIEDMPYWVSHWDDAVFASFAGNCWINLGDPARAHPYSNPSWQRSHGQTRREVFAAGQLAKSAALEGEIEQSIAHGISAMQSASTGSSKRSHRVICEVVEALKPYSTLESVREFGQQVFSFLPR